jgi:hypothetical protein
LFFLPLQCFIIGDDLGLGIQGAVFRYQMTTQGNSLIPIPFEIGYITSGIYTGKTAVSVILWALGTLILVCTTIFSLIQWNQLNRRGLKFIIIGIAGSCILYLASCITWYGLLFSGPSGTTLPVGIIIMAMFVAFLYYYQDLFIDTNAGS